jgi:predicted metal-dependent phosphoesterase TrpH
MAVDLHLHSSSSDGTDTPTRIVELAAAERMTCIALTDHDTLDGIAEARDASARAGIEFIAGIELSVDFEGKKMHMLVYFLEPGSGPLQDQLGELRAGRNRRNDAIVDKLNELGYGITMDDVTRHAAGRSIGRPHIADALVEKGHVTSRNEAFSGILDDGGAAYVERDRLTALDAITLARASSAVPVIAHPTTIGLTRDEAGPTFRLLAEHGLGGIEAHHPKHDLALRAKFEEIASDLSIAATGGSDYHGSDVREFRVGRGTGDLDVPDRAVDQLRDQLAR